MALFSSGFCMGALLGGAKGSYHAIKNYKPTKSDIYLNSSFIGIGLGMDVMTTHVSMKVLGGQVSQTLFTDAITHPFVSAWSGVCVGMGLLYYCGYIMIDFFKVPANMSDNSEYKVMNNCDANKKE